jgi:hypothetical protein
MSVSCFKPLIKAMSDKTALDELPRLIPERDAAKYLNRSVSSLRRWRRQGLISWRKIGGVYFAREDIEEFLERSKHPAEVANA